ncbi:TetR/AcrR family transcriptional regulator C-terminal domain-containing protein [Polycladidibacter hongkongensis]|uniref:TetR/AcrR family transcriptional regulator C-terminal domain-containing protein n=1 Tax=Polycladidibacter hongkongensis TaxID=1647556 RepID=UPI000829A2CE|nr:TetR/AcrR family transcriptional regulator C-terminal domain-containing protein [Pseudovibrio hongkongensis]
MSETATQYTERQTAVLDAALALLVDGGEKALTTAAIAKAAGCSKESLYKWFGDRDGLLAAIVTRQASKVRTPTAPARGFTEEDLHNALVAFAHNLLQVICGDVSIALNRLAISQASKGDPSLGKQLLRRGRGHIGAQTTILLRQAEAAGFLKFDSAEAAYQVLYGLVLQDIQLRVLLGDSLRPEEQNLKQLAEAAVRHFQKLYQPN